MATRVCPECGTQYVASVRRCIDCDAMLVDEVGADGEITPTVATPLGAGDQIAYEVDGWGNQLRVTLTGMLDLHGIPHVWEVGTLVVAAPFEEAVDELIAAVEGGEAEELAADVPQIAFEIEGVSADELAALDAELIAAHIPHAWQETGELLVPEEAEDEVAGLIDAVLNPPEEDDAEDGLATHAALDALYVAVDKLGKDPTDRKLIDRYTAAARDLDGRTVPYGMSGNEWDELLAQVDELRAAIDPEPDGGEGTADGDEDEPQEAGDETSTDPPAGSVDASDDGASAEGGRVEAVAVGAVADDADAKADAQARAVALQGAPESDDGDDGDDGDDETDEAGPEDPIDRARELIGQLRTRMLDLV